MCRGYRGPLVGLLWFWLCTAYRMTAIRNIDFHIATLTVVRRQQKVAFQSCKKNGSTDRTCTHTHTHASKYADVMWKLCVVICARRRKRKSGRRRTQTKRGGGARAEEMEEGRKQTQKNTQDMYIQEEDIGGRTDAFTYVWLCVCESSDGGVYVSRYADVDMKNWNTLTVKADSQFLSTISQSFFFFAPPQSLVALGLVVFWHFFAIALFITVFLFGGSSQGSCKNKT